MKFAIIGLAVYSVIVTVRLVMLEQRRIRFLAAQLRRSRAERHDPREVPEFVPMDERVTRPVPEADAPVIHMKRFQARG